MPPTTDKGVAARAAGRLRGLLTRAKCVGAGLGRRLVEVLGTCADAWAAAHMYEDLARLSDAELERRGIPRGDLHRHVFDALDGRP